MAGIAAHVPFIYGTIPGILGGTLAIIAATRFFRDKKDLAGLIATACGFIYYQAYQANPFTLPDFTSYIAVIPEQDQLFGIFLANLTTAMLLVSYHAMSGLLGGTIDAWIPRSVQAARTNCDGPMLLSFFVLFAVVAAPNILFGQVVVGSIESIVSQRAAWADPTQGGYAVFGGALGSSFTNVMLWTVSLFLLWLYLLGSRFRFIMWVLAPLVLLWTAAVALQGSRTYLVALALAFAVYVLGSPNLGRRALFHIVWAVPMILLLVQVSALFRTTGLKSFDAVELTAHGLEIRGNEGASSEMDGIEYFRTEIFNRGVAPNPLTGFFRGMFERPIEGALMVIPRTLFPWKPNDPTATEYSLFFQNVRLGVPSEEAFLGASPGLVGRELIKYGLLGPFTMLFWMGLILVLANRFYDADPSCAYHRICAASLVAFFIAQARDFVPVWFIPFLPVALILAIMAWRSHHWTPVLTVLESAPDSRAT